MLAVLSIVSLLATLPVAPSLPIWGAQIPINPGFPYGSKPVRGVNLGGWLVIEVCYQSPVISLPTSFILTTTCAQPWITPSLFEQTGNTLIVDEWTFGQYQDPNVAQAKLNQHWATWITENDFAAIAGAGWVPYRSKSAIW
jgi:glucan 1,3-beta-glucosidase